MDNLTINNWDNILFVLHYQYIFVSIRVSSIDIQIFAVLKTFGYADNNLFFFF